MNWITLYNQCQHHDQRVCLLVASFWMSLADCQSYQRQQILSECLGGDIPSMMSAADRNSMHPTEHARLVSQPY